MLVWCSDWATKLFKTDFKSNLWVLTLRTFINNCLGHLWLANGWCGLVEIFCTFCTDAKVSISMYLSHIFSHSAAAVTHLLVITAVVTFASHLVTCWTQLLRCYTLQVLRALYRWLIINNHCCLVADCLWMQASAETGLTKTGPLATAMHDCHTCMNILLSCVEFKTSFTYNIAIAM